MNATLLEISKLGKGGYFEFRGVQIMLLRATQKIQFTFFFHLSTKAFHFCYLAAGLLSCELQITPSGSVGSHFVCRLSPVLLRLDFLIVCLLFCKMRRWIDARFVYEILVYEYDATSHHHCTLGIRIKPPVSFHSARSSSAF